MVYSDALLTNGNIQSITGLPDGTYQLEEVKTPNGYINAIGSIEFKVEGGVITSQTAENSDKVDLDITGTIGLLTITNTPGAALPNTGGLGTNMIYFLGIMLTGLAGTGLVMKRRRRNAA